MIPDDLLPKIAKRVTEAAAGYGKLLPGDATALLREVRVHRARLLGWTTREVRGRRGVCYEPVCPADPNSLPTLWQPTPDDALAAAHAWCEDNCPAAVAPAATPGTPGVADPYAWQEAHAAELRKSFEDLKSNMIREAAARDARWRAATGMTLEETEAKAEEMAHTDTRDND